MSTTPAPLTYGDTFTLPSITHATTGEPVTFKIQDVRDIEHAGDMYEDRATAYALAPESTPDNPIRLNTQHAVKIGRTERAAASLPTFRTRNANGRLGAQTYGADFTDKMNATVSAEFDALSLDLPGYTLAELRDALIAAAADHGESLGHLNHGHRLAWDEYQQHAPARALRGEAMDADTRRAMHDALVAAFAAKAADRLSIGS